MHASEAKQLLIVDDEPELRSLLTEYFSRHNFSVRAVADAAAARLAVSERAPDLAILDVHMPGENGLSLARWLRESHPSMGLLMLTTAGDPIDRIVGLEVGADDYVPKPFEIRELLARVRSILRRSALAIGMTANHVSPAGGLPQTPAAASRQVMFGGCRLDLDLRQLYDAQGQLIDISAAEFDLLQLFANNPERPLNRDQIMQQAHNRGWDVFDRSIDLRIMRLRRKIETNPDHPEVIKTVRGVGYKFMPPQPG